MIELDANIYTKFFLFYEKTRQSTNMVSSVHKMMVFIHEMEVVSFALF